MENSHTRAISSLCALGLFLAGYIFYSSSLLETYFTAEFHLSSWEIGIAQATVPLGAILGALLAGRLADLLGRHRLLVLNFFGLAILGLLGIFIVNYFSLCSVRFLNGFAAGTLYPLCATYLIEMMPEASLARQSALLMFINCLAAPFVCVLALIFSYVCQDAMLWRLLSMGHALPSIIAYFFAKKLPESRLWLLYKNNNKQLKKGWKYLASGVTILFNPSYRRLTFCLAGAWFLMDVAYYGINFFVPYLLEVMQLPTNNTLWETFIINLFFMASAWLAIFIVEKIDLLALQKWGFLFASLSLFALAILFYFGLRNAYGIILLFILFNFALNLGPDVTTYLFSATAYPVSMRGTGHGFSAGFAKLGSFLGVLFLPKLQELYGYEMVIFLLALLLLTAYFLTLYFANTQTVATTLTETGIAYETN